MKNSEVWMDPDKLKNIFINDLKGTHNYVIGEVLKLARGLHEVPSLDNQELKNMIQAQLHSENTRAINLPSNEASIRKKINSRIEKGESAELYSEIEELIKRNRKHLTEIFESSESIGDAISNKFASDILVKGISVFKLDGSPLYLDEKNDIRDKLFSVHDIKVNAA